jgi:hypothetical protein
MNEKDIEGFKALIRELFQVDKSDKDERESYVVSATEDEMLFIKDLVLALRRTKVSGFEKTNISYVFETAEYTGCYGDIKLDRLLEILKEHADYAAAEEKGGAH